MDRIILFLDVVAAAVLAAQVVRVVLAMAFWGLVFVGVVGASRRRRVATLEAEVGEALGQSIVHVTVATVKWSALPLLWLGVRWWGGA